jgi:hypothetical protein
VEVISRASEKLDRLEGFLLSVKMWLGSLVDFHKWGEKLIRMTPGVDNSPIPKWRGGGSRATMFHTVDVV